MNITKLTDYSLILLCEMRVGEVISSQALSEKTKIPFATVNKLLHILNKGGFCLSKAGKNGGFILIKDHSEISFLNVIDCIEGNKTHLTECATTQEKQCQLKKHCKITKKIELIDMEIRSVLSNKFLSDLL